MTIRRGNILPLAIIMTTMILMAGVGIGVVVLEGSQRALTTDQSVSAYYMADSGIERQLFELRKRDKTTADLSVLNENYPNQGTWAFNGGYTSTTEKIFTTMATSSFEVVDIFNPDNVSAAGVDHLDVSWADGADCTGGLQAGLEVGYTEWDVTGGSISISSAYVIQRSSSGSHTMTVPLNTTKAFRVRLKSLTCTASMVTVQARDAGGAAVAFPGDVTLAATGTYGKATQNISVTMPKTNVLSGVFSFVLFSECTLLKGAGTPTCPP